MFKVQKLYWISILAVSLFILCTVTLFAKELSSETQQCRAIAYEAQRKGKLEKAIRYYERALSLEPNSEILHNDLGIVYEMQGSYDSAEAAYLKALSANPNYLKAITNLALLYESLGKVDRAVHYFRKRARLGSPDDPWTKKAKRKLELLEGELAARKAKLKAAAIERAARKKGLVLKREVAVSKKEPIQEEALTPEERELQRLVNEMRAEKKRKAVWRTTSTENRGYWYSKKIPEKKCR